MLGGSLMMLFAVFVFGRIGAGQELPARLIDATFDGVQALVGASGVIVAGLAIHAVVAVVWGIVFGFVVRRRTSVGAVLGGGMIYGLIVWVTMTYLVLPWANPTMYPRVRFLAGPLMGSLTGAPTGAWIAAHLIYGASLVVVSLFMSTFEPTLEARPQRKLETRTHSRVSPAARERVRERASSHRTRGRDSLPPRREHGRARVEPSGRARHKMAK